MRTARTTTRARGERFALAAVAVAMFGLLSMHGWGSHAGHIISAAPHDVSITSTDHGGMHHPDRAAAPLTTESPADPAPDGPAPAHGGGEAGALFGLCLAILTGILLALCLLVARRGTEALSNLLPAWRHPVVIGRDRDPPDLLELCVTRC